MKKTKPYCHLKKSQRKEAKALLKSIAAVPGEKRQIYICKCCNKISGCRFIPFAIGRGYRVNQCLEEITGGHPVKTLLLESSP